jgi:hypothetical protein
VAATEGRSNIKAYLSTLKAVVLIHASHSLVSSLAILQKLLTCPCEVRVDSRNADPQTGKAGWLLGQDAARNQQQLICDTLRRKAGDHLHACAFPLIAIANSISFGGKAWGGSCVCPPKMGVQPCDGASRAALACACIRSWKSRYVYFCERLTCSRKCTQEQTSDKAWTGDEEKGHRESEVTSNSKRDSLPYHWDNA